MDNNRADDKMLESAYKLARLDDKLLISDYKYVKLVEIYLFLASIRL